MQVLVLPDAAAAATKAADFVADAAGVAIRKRGRFLMALSGGSTPWLMLTRLAALAVDWSRVHVFQVDERVSPDGDSNRNWTHINAVFLSKVSIPAEQVHPMPVTRGDLREAAAAYAEQLRQVAGVPPKLDLVHLGLGLDGHTASLVPNDSVLLVRDAEVAVTDDYQSHRRLTLTFQALNRARNVLWLTTGSDKHEVLSRLLSGDTSIPAGRVRGVRATVFADTGAIGLSASGST